MLAYRKEKSRQREFFTERILEAVSTQFESHAERLNERREALIRCLENLDGRKRELVNEYYSSNKDSAERIAAKLSITPNALRQALFRVRKLLYECVERTVRLESRG